MIAFSQEAQRAADLGIAAAIALAVWLVLLGLLAMATRPRLPRAAPPTSDLAGPESPAVVNLLVNRWALGHEAVPATLLDLAARKAVDIERMAPDRYAVRLRRSVPADLTGYERQVLDHVKGLAAPAPGTDTANVVVPCEALTTGPEEQSAGWWRRFRKAVVADARRQGLSRPRWGRAAVLALGIAGVAPAVLTAAAFVAIPESSSSASEEDDPVIGVLVLAAAAWTGLLSVPFWLRAERDTATGRTAAARWLGVKEYLDESESFDRAPPTAVAIWDRYLAYGAAMGVAAGAVRALPLGSESDREAWSAYGGHWHLVRVRYPSRFPPGWGRKPLVVVAKALALLAAAALVAARIGSALTGAVDEFFRLAGENDWRLASTVVTVVLAVAAAGLAVVLLRAAALLGLGLVDLFARRTVEGLVVRLRNGYVAVDDGRTRQVRAWKAEPAKLAGVTRGTVVRATVSPALGYVFSLEPVGARPEQAGLAGAPVNEPG